MSHVSRRNWLKRTALASVAVALGCESTRSGARERRNPAWKTAIGLNGFGSSASKYKKRFPIWEVLDFAADAGFDGIELMGGWPQGNYPTADETQRVRALRRLYDLYGLQIFSLQTGADRAFDPSAEKRREWIIRMRDHIALAKALGCDCIGMWPYGGLRGQTIDRAIAHLASSLREVAKIADDHGIVSAFEIEPPFAFNSEQHLLQILEIANDERVKTIYDPSHFDLMNGSTGRPHEMLQRIGVQHIGYVHFTDTDGTLRPGETSKHLPAGDGHVDIPATFQTLHAGGFRGWVMVDAWQIPDPYDAGRKGIRAIRDASTHLG